VYKQILINAILRTGKRGPERDMSGRSACRRRRSALGAVPSRNNDNNNNNNNVNGGNYFCILSCILFMLMSDVRV
jgi:hypothetical protein